MVVNEDILNFANFLDYYKEDYINTSKEISRPKPDEDDDEEVDINDLDPLVSSTLKMLDFDLMCKNANFYPNRNKIECNRPKTVDGLYYQIIEEDKIIFYLVEFKSFYYDFSTKKKYAKTLKDIFKQMKSVKVDKDIRNNIIYLKKLQKGVGNNIEFSLRLKPYESLFVVLPMIYDEYCEVNGIPEEKRLDLYEFFQSDLCDTKLFVVGKKGTDTYQAHTVTLGKLLDKQYRRLDFVNVLIPHKRRLCFEYQFERWAKNTQLNERRNIRTLNYHYNPNK